MATLCDFCRSEVRGKIPKNRKSYWPKGYFELPGVKFKHLKGHPFMCERCLLEKLGHKRFWDEQAEDLIVEGVKNAN